jgi:hypothetical protein
MEAIKMRFSAAHDAADFCLPFSSREPVFTSPENALV